MTFQKQENHEIRSPGGEIVHVPSTVVRWYDSREPVGYPKNVS